MNNSNNNLSHKGFFASMDEDAYRAYKQQTSMLWLPEKLDYTLDKEDYANLKDNERDMLDMILGFFAPFDGIVSDTIVDKLYRTTNNIQERAFYTAQNFIETVHAETYGLILETIVPDPEKKMRMKQLIDTNEPMKKKGLWADSFISADVSRSESLLAMACTEGIFFTASFLFIFYFRARKVLPNIITANEYISRDEALHRDTGIMFYRKTGLLSDERAHQMVREAVDLELEFVRDVLKTPVEGLSYQQVRVYVEDLADNLLSKCGHPTIYHPDKTIIPQWMKDISMDQKNNFYELTVTSYNHFSLNESVDWQGRTNGKYATLKKLAFENPSSVDF